ncbi:MAG: endonuclease/exonuclease/phosphatase family protein [Nitrospira sp.]|nr:hypothetical protein [Candidatus Manganitrophaceae bacterium]HIL35829.1 hypothetical protein [Candidatus Manganitrophaceae bacterium]
MLKAGFDFFSWGTKFTGVFVLLLGYFSYMGALPHYIELSTHFRLQYFIASLLVTGAFFLRHEWQWLVLGFIAIGINGVGVLPWHLASPDRSVAGESPSLRLFHSNVLSSNKQYSRLMALVSEEKPDIVFLQETNQRWLDALEPLKEDFPYFFSSPGSDDLGIALFSRIPLSQSEIIDLGDPIAPSIHIKFSFQDKQISLLTTHLSSPRLGSNFQARNSQLEQLARFAKMLPLPAIIIGDLNVTKWSPYYRKFVKDSGLISVREGFGLLPTWPVFLPFMMIPIDHGFVTEGLKVVGVKTGRSIGSDHLPLIVDISL